MRIAIIGPSYPYRGGIAAGNERLALQFHRQGHTATIYTFTVQYPGFLFPGKSQYSEDREENQLRIVRCINSVNPLNWLLVGNRIKRQRYDLVVIRYWLPFMGPCFGTILRRVRRNGYSKIISIVDNIVPHEPRIGDTLLTKYFVKPVDGFIAMSQGVLDGIGCFSRNKPRLLSPHPLFDNFGDISSREEAIEKLGMDIDCRYILFFGLIRHYKGLDLLIRAFADERFRGRSIKLIVAGEYYDDKSKYVSLIEANQLEKDVIQVDKFIPNSEVAHYFNACDLVVQPYRSATQSGVTQIAFHFNKPMIVTGVGGLKEMCPDGKVGFVVPVDPSAIADAIIRFFDESCQAEMAKNIVEEKNKYSWEILVDNIFALINDLDK